MADPAAAAWYCFSIQPIFLCLSPKIVLQIYLSDKYLTKSKGFLQRLQILGIRVLNCYEITHRYLPNYIHSLPILIWCHTRHVKVLSGKAQLTPLLSWSCFKKQ